MMTLRQEWQTIGAELRLESTNKPTCTRLVLRIVLQRFHLYARATGLAS